MPEALLKRVNDLLAKHVHPLVRVRVRLMQVMGRRHEHFDLVAGDYDLSSVKASFHRFKPQIEIELDTHEEYEGKGFMTFMMAVVMVCYCADPRLHGYVVFADAVNWITAWILSKSYVFNSRSDINGDDPEEWLRRIRELKQQHPDRPLTDEEVAFAGGHLYLDVGANCEAARRVMDSYLAFVGRTLRLNRDNVIGKFAKVVEKAERAAKRKLMLSDDDDDDDDSDGSDAREDEEVARGVVVAAAVLGAQAEAAARGGGGGGAVDEDDQTKKKKRL